MGAYTDHDAVRAVLAPDGNFTDPATAASLDDNVIDDAIMEAEQTVDATLAGRYPVPFGTGAYPQVPPIVAQLARDMAAYEATLRFFRGQPLPDNHPIMLRQQRAQTMLSNMQSGRVELPDTTPQEVPSSQAVAVNDYDGDLFTLPGMGIGRDGRPTPLRSPFDGI